MAFESYVIKNGKKLRRGYTTGSAATSAAKAATKMLFSSQQVDQIRIDTPAGVELELKVVNTKLESGYAQATIIKDGGDDPDVTDGLEIRAKVEKTKGGIQLRGGVGVGRVTKPGLPIDQGQAAINPVPRQMISQEINKVLPIDEGVRITIEVPKGVETAQKTLNPKLGITGGISILGTTGIVEPMSEQAYKDSLAISVDQAVASGIKKLVLVFGNYGKRRAKKSGFKDEAIIRMSNFVGFMLEHCVKQQVEKVTIIGHIGKLVKVAAGIFNTHSQLADARLETIAAHTASLGGSQELIKQILAANTAEETVGIIQEASLEQVFDLLAKRVTIRAQGYIDNALEVNSLLFSMEEGIIGKCS
ncbi:cobalt-precorrin-5B (C(1))-methyltransferase CbiD [Halanaerobaculum tunisiense]